MTKNERSGRALCNGGIAQLAPGQALWLGPLGGELTVLAGCVWLTRSGDPGDHILGWGDRICLVAGENAVIEPMGKNQSASLRWSPRRNGMVRALLAEILLGAAFAFGLAARGFSAIARSASVHARRAQGYLEL